MTEVARLYQSQQERWRAELDRRLRDAHPDELILRLPKNKAVIVSAYVKQQYFAGER